jgi:hypothetical protein
MRFEQTREILNHIRDFHSSLSHCYQQLEDDKVRERTELLLDYLVTREKDLASAIEDFTSDADKELLDTWFQFADETKLLTFACPVIENPAEMSTDEVIQLAEQAHNCMISAFDEILENCETARVRDVFQQLHDQASRQWRHLVHETNLLSDI